MIMNIEDIVKSMTKEQQDDLSLMKEYRIKGLYRYCISTGRYDEEIISYEDFKTMFFVPCGDGFLFRYRNSFCVTKLLDQFHTLYRQANAIKG